MVGVEDAHLQHRESLLEEEAFETVIRTARFILSFPSNRVIWAMLEGNFSQRFIDFINAQISSEPLMAPTDISLQLKTGIDQLVPATAV